MGEFFDYSLMVDRNEGLFSTKTQQKIKESTVCIAGCGGVGGVTAECLTRMGVGSLVLSDPENFDLSNFNRQIGASLDSLGNNKASSLATRLKLINPDLEIHVLSEGLNENNYDFFISKADLVIDAIDYFAPDVRRDIYRLANKKNISVISTPAIGFGTLGMNFSPSGYSLENLLDQKGQFKTNKLLAGDVSYLTPNFFKRVSDGFIPSNCSAVYLAGSLGSLQSILTLTSNPSIISMPYAIKMDLFNPNQKVIDLRDY